MMMICDDDDDDDDDVFFSFVFEFFFFWLFFKKEPKKRADSFGAVWTFSFPTFKEVKTPPPPLPSLPEKNALFARRALTSFTALWIYATKKWKGITGRSLASSPFFAR